MRIKSLTVLILTCLIYPALAAASDCDEKLSFYHRSIPGKEYASGYTVPQGKRVDELLLPLVARIQPFMANPRSLKPAIKKLSLKEKIRWLHEFSFADAEVAADTLESGNPMFKRMMATMGSGAAGVVNYLTSQVVKAPAKQLFPYLEELKAILTNLTMSFGGAEASLELQIRLAEMTKEIPELNSSRMIILIGIVDHIAAAPNLTERGFAKLKASFDEYLAHDPPLLQPSARVLMLSHFMLRCLDYMLDEPVEPTPVEKEYLRYLVDLMPRNIDSLEQAFGAEATGAIQAILSDFLEKVRAVPDILNPQQIAVLEFLRGGRGHLQ